MLTLEQLETRYLLAPIAPFELDLEPGGDSGLSDSDDITGLDNGTVQLIAEANSTVNVYNGAALLGAGVQQNDYLFYETDGTVVIDAEAGTCRYPMRSWTSYIRAYGTTAASPDGSSTYRFYITTPGTYYVRAYVRWSSSSQNSIFVNIDDTWQPSDTGPALWSTNYTEYHSVTAATTVDVEGEQTWALDAGWHTLQFYGREQYAYVDRFAISTNIAADPAGAASKIYETYTYSFLPGDLIGSEAGQDNSITATAIKSGTSPASEPLVIRYDSGTTVPDLPDLAAGSDSGPVNGDNITADPNGVFTGTAEPESTVWLRVGGADRRSVTAGVDGGYSLTAQAGDLAEGDNLVDIYYVDSAGNVSSDSVDLTVTLDSSIRQPSAPELDSADDSGRSNQDHITNVTTAAVTGSAGAVEGNCTVTLRIGGADCCSTTANPDGSYGFTLSPGDLAEGENVLDIYCEDAAGNMSTDSAGLIVTLDTLAPTGIELDLQPSSDTGFSDSDNRTSYATGTVDGTTEPFALVDLYLNSELIIQLAAAADGYWSYTFSPGVLATGVNDLSVYATDMAGNLSAGSEILSVLLENQGQTPTAPVLDPVVAVMTPSGRWFANTMYSEISGMAASESTVEILVAGAAVGTIQADGAGEWSYSFHEGELAEGLNQIEVISTDTAGNTQRSAPLQVTVDTIAPKLQSYSPSGVSSQSTNVLKLYLDTDVVDLTALAGLEGFGLWASGGDGTFGEANDYAVGIVGATFIADTRCAQLDLGAVLAEETYRLIINAGASLRDWAGNPAYVSAGASQAEGFYEEVSIVLDFSIDMTSPVVPGIPVLAGGSDSGSSNNDGITHIAQPDVLISGETGVSLEVFCNGYTAGLAAEIGAGEYVLTIPSGLIREGVNLLAARAGDTAGNWSAMSALGTMVYDSISPVTAAIGVEDSYLNHGPSEISVIIEDANIDADLLISASNYYLVGSGGDGIFNNGNETQTEFSDIAYDAIGRKVVLTLPQSATGVSRLDPDRYRLMVSAEGGLADLAGNGLCESAWQEFLVAPAAVLQHDQDYRFQDASGRDVIVKLSGPGEAQIVLGTSTGSGNTIDTILVRGTTEATKLDIQSSRTGGPVLVGSILTDGPLQALRGQYVQITEALIADGFVRQILVGSIATGAVVNLASDDTGIQLDAGVVGSDVDIYVEGHLASLSMARFAGGSISAASAGAITVKTGDLHGDIVITEGDLDRLVIRKGDFSGRVEVAGNLVSLKASQGTVFADIVADAIDEICCRRMMDNVVRSAGDIDSVCVRRAEKVSLSAERDLNSFFAAYNVTNSTVAAGRNCGKIVILGNCVDNLLLAGADLGRDGCLNSLEDGFRDGNIGLLKVKGSYLGTTTAAAINPGADSSFFTEDDYATSSGQIKRVMFTEASLTQIGGDHDYGLISTEALPQIRVLGQNVTAPFILERFHLQTVSN